jgi:hypothetical protein
MPAAGEAAALHCTLCYLGLCCFSGAYMGNVILCFCVEAGCQQQVRRCPQPIWSRLCFCNNVCRGMSRLQQLELMDTEAVRLQQVRRLSSMKYTVFPAREKPRKGATAKPQSVIPDRWAVLTQCYHVRLFSHSVVTCTAMLQQLL